MDEKDYIKTLNEMFQVESKIIDDIDCENEKIPERLEKKILKGVRKRKNRNIKIAVGTGIAVATTCLSLIIWQNNQSINKESSSSVSEIPVNEKKTTEDGKNMDDKIVGIDAIQSIKAFKEPLVLAVYTGVNEVSEINIEGAQNKYLRYKYNYKLENILANKPDYVIPDEFVLCVGEISYEEYPEIKGGDRVILSIRNDSTGMAGYADNEFIWSLQIVYFVKEDGTIISAGEEGKELNGLSVEELQEKIGD